MSKDTGSYMSHSALWRPLLSESHCLINAHIFLLSLIQIHLSFYNIWLHKGKLSSMFAAQEKPFKLPFKRGTMTVLHSLCKKGSWHHFSEWTLSKVGVYLQSLWTSFWNLKRSFLHVKFDSYVMWLANCHVGLVSRANKNITLLLSWNVVPNAGILPLVAGSGHVSLPFPETYETTRSY